MSGIVLAINLVIAIAVILILVLKFKVNPVISMVVAALYMGISSGLGIVKTGATINSGFGNLMTGIGLPIGFGIILGEILSVSGAAEALARSLLKAFPGDKAAWALGLTAFILSIPVFFDVTFVILIPLGLAVVRRTGEKNLPYIAGAIAIGGVCSQTFVPPTPNPLAAATILNFDLGMMVVVGMIVGLIAAIVAMTVWFKALDKGIWKPEEDETGLVEEAASTPESKRDLPSAWAAIIPIVIPVLCIVISSFWGMFSKSTPIFISFISNKTVAILLGVLAAYAIAKAKMSWKDLSEATAMSLKGAGVVLLITGAGGSFGAVIQATNIGATLTKNLSGSSSTIIILLVTFAIGVVFRVAQGSGTVASITSMTIMASVAPQAACHPVYIAVAALAGGNFLGHVNDSGYWIVTNMSGLSVKGGLKTYTFNTAVLAGTAFILCLIGVSLFPMI
jgi:GntP family gluconate:H+ symporter